MCSSISIQEKKFFIQWFLKNYELKNRESRRILEYLLTDETLLNNIHFVREAKFCPRAIILTTTCSDEVSFRFHKQHVITNEVEKSFHDLRLCKHQPMYIQINFYNAYQNEYYIAVLEDNPYIPENIQLKEQDQMIAKQMLENILIERKQATLKKMIDHSLEKNNRKAFFKLVDELNKLEEQKH